MNILITRQKSAPTGTPGDLLVKETGFSCKTLELNWDDNSADDSCILPGVYTASPWFSPHLGRMVLRLVDANGRTNILVHNGNFAGNVSQGLFCQVLGCILVGIGYGQLERPDTQALQFGILSSITTLANLLENIGDGPHQITIEWADGCAPIQAAQAA